MSEATDWLGQERVSSPTQDVVRDIVERAEMKLVTLEAERSQVLKRIHALRYLLALTPESHASQSCPPDDCAAVRRKTATDGKSSTGRRTQRPHAPVAGHPLHNHGLARACRIALIEIESDRAASSLEVLQRITRRGSFNFETCRNPLAAIEEELARMAQNGEVAGIGITPRRRWKWRPE